MGAYHCTLLQKQIYMTFERRYARYIRGFMPIYFAGAYVFELRKNVFEKYLLISDAGLILRTSSFAA
jgi:hypothetical protein